MKDSLRVNPPISKFVIDKSSINFIGIGAQKAGTSWLFSNLKKLPDFSLGIKEIHYFDKNKKYSSPNTLSESKVYKRVLIYEWVKFVVIMFIKAILRLDFIQINWALKWMFYNYNDEWYLSLFKNLKGFSGEISPSYAILEENDIRKMYKLAPDAKIIFILRDPIERAWSHYRFSRKHSSKKSRSKFKHESIIDFINSDDQLLRSNYIDTLEKYSKIFPEAQILVCFYDAIIDCPEKLLKEIVQFIGANPNNIDRNCDLLEKVNVSKVIDCPSEIEEYLKKHYYGLINQLAETYGGYFNVWLQKNYSEKPYNIDVTNSSFCLQITNKR
ncbi:hypothetical protein GCM10011506_21790 [Marivirga lumbricoides]|uniref:Sulfotransferase domain-containing protein n=1 Tax=Marivirga lumbricoides TaxID=1046115 RepID=A0ABQ1M7Z9_9BACT|nr:hypothetical protein GCM10011506_21790 [Marivirga lumbricoides]